MPTKKRVQYPTVTKLVNSKPGTTRIYARTLDKSISQLATRFEGRKVEGSLFVDLHDDDAAKYTLSMKGGQAEVTKEETRADLTVRTDKATWVEMATGRLSPVEAFLMGKMELHGDIGLGKRLYALAAKSEQIDGI